MKIPVIIPFYKRRDQLDRCLAHLRRQTVEVEAFVRDNTHDNVFFTAAVNEGLCRYLDRADAAPYVVVLNQDMYLQPDAVEHLVQCMDRRPRCGIAAPLHLHRSNPRYVVSGGGLEAFPAGAWRHGPLARFSQDAEVPWADGACLMLRREMIRRIGMLDENYVFIGSDSDYCFTARLRGWQVWIVAAARGVHEQGMSSRRANPALEVRKVKDMLYFGQKWLTGQAFARLAGPAGQVAPETAAATLDRMRQALMAATADPTEQTAVR